MYTCAVEFTCARVSVQRGTFRALQGRRWQRRARGGGGAGHLGSLSEAGGPGVLSSPALATPTRARLHARPAHIAITGIAVSLPPCSRRASALRRAAAHCAAGRRMMARRGPAAATPCSTVPPATAAGDAITQSRGRDSGGGRTRRRRRRRGRRRGRRQTAGDTALKPPHCESAPSDMGGDTFMHQVIHRAAAARAVAHSACAAKKFVPGCVSVHARRAAPAAATTRSRGVFTGTVLSRGQSYRHGGWPASLATRGGVE